MSEISESTTPSPELLAYLAARLPKVEWRWKVNHITLRRWLAKVGEAQIRERLDLTAYPYPEGGGIYCWSGRDFPPHRERWLKNWEWEVTAPKEKVFGFAL